MENFKTELLSYRKGGKRSFIISYIVIAIGLIILSFSAIKLSEPLPKAKDPEDVKTSNEYVSLELEILSDYFAEYTSDGRTEKRFYFSTTEDRFVILELSDKEFEKACDAIDNDNTYEITGMTENVGNDLKKIAIESINELYEEDIVTTYNFDEYVIPYYINTKENPNSYVTGFIILGSIVVLVGGLIFIIGFSNKRQSKKSIDEIEKKYGIEELASEFSMPTYEFKIANIKITKNYIISGSVKLDIIRISDIVWVYPNYIRTNGVKTRQSVIVYTKNKKRINIADMSATGKNNNEEYEKMYQVIATIKPNMLVGYTMENINLTSSQNIDETIRQLESRE